MNVRRVLGLASIAMTATGCGPKEPTATAPLPASSVVSATGDVTMAMQGMSFVLEPRLGAYTERDPRTGAQLSFSVTPIVVTESFNAAMAKPQLSIGVLDGLRAGTFRVRVAGSGASSIPEFRATLIVPAANGTVRHYEMDQGVLVITQVHPLQATLTAKASRMLEFPASYQVGTTVSSMPASVTVTSVMGDR